MILINNIWYNETDVDELVELAKSFNNEFGKALEEQFSYYQSIEDELNELKSWKN